MRQYTDQEISELIHCKKRVTERPSKQKEIRGSIQSNMQVESLDGRYKFNVFFRQSAAFEEDFSIGLTYNPYDDPGTITLLRCNSRHGSHQAAFPHHLMSHIHTVLAADINEGIKREKHIETTDKYSSFLEAVEFFIITTEIQGADEFFPRPSRQGDLFADQEAGGENENHRTPE